LGFDILVWDEASPLRRASGEFECV
jgi:hypothetical protein